MHDIRETDLFFATEIRNTCVKYAGLIYVSCINQVEL